MRNDVIIFKYLVDVVKGSVIIEELVVRFLFLEVLLIRYVLKIIYLFKVDSNFIMNKNGILLKYCFSDYLVY